MMHGQKNVKMWPIQLAFLLVSNVCIYWRTCGKSEGCPKKRMDWTQQISSSSSSSSSSLKMCLKKSIINKKQTDEWKVRDFEFSWLWLWMLRFMGSDAVYSGKYVQTFRTDPKLILQDISVKMKAEFSSETSMYIHRNTESHPKSALILMISDQCLGQGI